MCADRWIDIGAPAFAVRIEDFEDLGSTAAAGVKRALTRIEEYWAG